MFAQPPLLTCTILDTGYCLAWEEHVISGGAHRRIHCHSIVALLHHPRQGWLLWDTGYAPRMFSATRRFPFWFYRLITPLRLKPELAVVNQLQRRQIAPSDIAWVILSHFHADHLAGLRDFPQAKIACSAEAYRDVAARQGMSALRRAFIPALLPEDFETRATFVGADVGAHVGADGRPPLPEGQTPIQFSGPLLPHLGPTADLFDDGSLLLVSMPGHARGQLGLYTHTTRGPILLAADSCWLSRSFREQRPPPRIANLILDNPREARQTIDNLHEFALACPAVNIIPTHCPEAFARELASEP